MEYINYEKYLREFEKKEYERELRVSKQLLEAYQDIKEVVVPVMKQYIKLTPNKDFKKTAQTLLLMCDIGEAQLQPVCNNAKKTTLKELRIMNNNFCMSMEIVQKKYIDIVTKEFPENFENGFGV